MIFVGVCSNDNDNHQILVKNDTFWVSLQVRTTFSGAKLIVLTIFNEHICGE